MAIPRPEAGVGGAVGTRAGARRGARVRSLTWLAVAVVSMAAGAGAASADPAAPQVIDDRAMLARFVRSSEALREAGRTVPLADLTNQLGRASVRLKLARPSRRKPKPEALYQQAGAGTVIVGRFFKCTNCANWHINAAAGFALTSDGAIATALHVVSEGDGETLLVMRRDGEVFPVTEVLAASPASDLAIVRAAGSGFRPLPLGEEPPVGATVRVISHPEGRFYALTEGIVSRYYLSRSRWAPVAMMAITADFARGSSGGPVLDATGAVVGVVQSTYTIESLDREGKRGPPQMVLKQVIPSRHLRALITDR